MLSLVNERLTRLNCRAKKKRKQTCRQKIDNQTYLSCTKKQSPKLPNRSFQLTKLYLFIKFYSYQLIFFDDFHLLM